MADSQKALFEAMGAYITFLEAMAALGAVFKAMNALGALNEARTAYRSAEGGSRLWIRLLSFWLLYMLYGGNDHSGKLFILLSAAFAQSYSIYSIYSIYATFLILLARYVIAVF